jgi:hypothetical protein
MATPPDWPAANDVEAVEGGYVTVEIGNEEDGIVSGFAEFLAPQHPLTSRTDDDQFIATYGGRDYVVPLSYSTHDIYITVSSLAEILRGEYAVFVDRTTVGESFNNLVVAALATLDQRGPLPPHLVPLQVGFDYFTGDPAAGAALAVPYVGHAAPGFAEGQAAHAAKVEGGRAMIDVMLGSVFTGKIDDAKLKVAASALGNMPEVKAELGGRPSADIADELRKVMQQALAEPDVAKSVTEARQAMDEVRKLTGQPPLSRPRKPWWKFW